MSACKYYSTVHTIINQSNISKPIKAKLFEKLVCSETDKMERYCIAPQTIKIFIGFAKQIGDIKKRADEFCNLSQRDIIVERNCHKQVQKQVIQPCLQIPAQMRLNL